MRERQRRSITTTIFHGLRKHGGYPLSPRADINEVLRHLAHEAGWTVEPDGTTYRSTTSITSASIGTANACPLCGNGRGRSKSATPKSTSSYFGGGGDCSTTTETPHQLSGGLTVRPSLSTTSNSAIAAAAASSPQGDGTLLAVYMYGVAPPPNTDGTCSTAQPKGRHSQS